MGVARAELPQATAGTLPVRWVIITDRLSAGIANPQIMAAVTTAMHDAVNAVEPRYQRWFPAAADEPAGAGAAVDVALSMAAFHVLAAAFPVQSLRIEAEPLLFEVLRAAPSDPAQSGIALGSSIGAGVAMRFNQRVPVNPFPASDEPGHWRPTPPFFINGMVADTAPIAFDHRDGARGPPPPNLGSARYLADLEEVRRQGALHATSRTAEQTEIAEFWARQSSQRGFLYLGLRMLGAEPRPGSVWEEVRTLSALASALADSATLSWEEKRRHSHWRPITAIHQGWDGSATDPTWLPLLLTPPHPDYPSGHSADCGAGAAVLNAVFGQGPRDFVYIAMESTDLSARRFSSFDAAADECAESRVWAGAHFRFANDEGLRIGRIVAAAALARVRPRAAPSQR
jgi:hypothetical protein